MNRPGFDDVNFFFGREVERTPAYDMPTLFVVGVQPVEDIEYELSRSDVRIRHIFFGANHSFQPANAEDYETWDLMIAHFLKKGLLCSLDIPTTALHDFHDGGLCEYNNFIPQIRVTVPYIGLFNYNAMVKIDDKDFDCTNPGVWCHRLHDLMAVDKFTPWHHYDKDEVLT